MVRKRTRVCASVQSFFFARDKSVEKWNYRFERVAVLSYLSIVQDTKLITSSGDPLEEKE